MKSCTRWASAIASTWPRPRSWEAVRRGALRATPGTANRSSSAVGGDAAFPDNGDIVTGQYLYRKDSMDIDLYQFQVATEGDFSVETIAQRLENASSLNTALVLYNGNGQAIASQRRLLRHGLLYQRPLDCREPITSASAPAATRSTTRTSPNSGVGGTTEGAYQLRLNFQPLDNSQLVDARGIALDGDADGVPGGEYNYWFNVQSASPTAAQNHTLIVDKLSPGPTLRRHPGPSVQDHLQRLDGGRGGLQLR